MKTISRRIGHDELGFFNRQLASMARLDLPFPAGLPYGCDSRSMDASTPASCSRYDIHRDSQGLPCDMRSVRAAVS